MVGQEREQAALQAAEQQSASEEQVSLTSDESSDIFHDDMDFDMGTLLDESMSSIEKGQIITGRVLKVTDSDVVIDIGSKSEGMIPLSEFQDPGRELDVQAGMDVEVMVVTPEGRDGQPVLSRRRAQQRAARRIVRQAFEKGETIKCYVKDIVRGGFEVDVEGLRGFIPFSQMGPGARTKEDQKLMVGQVIEAKILEMRNKRDLILSQRKALDEKREKLRHETLSTLKEGYWVKGVVKNLTDFGAFVDLGGIDGLLHVKDMSWDHVAHPRDMVKVGDELQVMILSIEGERISLGLKQKTADPWLNIAERYPAGSMVGGKVTSMTKYGAFVGIEEGVEGLIHISEMSWTKRVKHPNEVLKTGEEVRVKVLDVDQEKKRISLSLRQTTVDPWTLAKTNYPPGSVIEGEVTGITDFGAFVRLPEGVDGMIHVSDLSWADKGLHPKKILKKGERVKAKVLEIDPSQQRISLGLKQMEPDPWEVAAKKYRPGTVVEVEVKRITEFGAFVELEENIEGLAHSSALVPKGQNHENVVKVGDRLKMKVTKFDLPQRKISLSLREYQREQEDREVEQFMKAESGGNATLGEMLGAQMQALMQQSAAQQEPQTETQATEQEAPESAAEPTSGEGVTVEEQSATEPDAAPQDEEAQVSMSTDVQQEEMVPENVESSEETADEQTNLVTEEVPAVEPQSTEPEVDLQPADVQPVENEETSAGDDAPTAHVQIEETPVSGSPEEQAVHEVETVEPTPEEKAEEEKAEMEQPQAEAVPEGEQDSQQQTEQGNNPDAESQDTREA
ncbi:MAG: 30S ribosomal protein S1 [bacterium]